MSFFITGTDTDIGKTVMATWLCLQTGFDYWKPIQTGNIEQTDTAFLNSLEVKTYQESYTYQTPVSPHLAAALENQEIQIDNIKLPKENNLIVEGAGGLLVPINSKVFMIDLILMLNLPVLLVSRTKLGCINHTLLSLEALRSRNIKVLGVIMNGEENTDNNNAIEKYGDIQVFNFPKLDKVNIDSIKAIALPKDLSLILNNS